MHLTASPTQKYWKLVYNGSCPVTTRTFFSQISMGTPRLILARTVGFSSVPKVWQIFQNGSRNNRIIGINFIHCLAGILLCARTGWLKYCNVSVPDVSISTDRIMTHYNMFTGLHIHLQHLLLLPLGEVFWDTYCNVINLNFSTLGWRKRFSEIPPRKRLLHVHNLYSI